MEEDYRRISSPTCPTTFPRETCEHGNICWNITGHHWNKNRKRICGVFRIKGNQNKNMVTGKKTGSAGEICIMNPDKLLGK